VPAPASRSIREVFRERWGRWDAERARASCT
jgi:hypothetical protein